MSGGNPSDQEKIAECFALLKSTFKLTNVEFAEIGVKILADMCGTAKQREVFNSAYGIRSQSYDGHKHIISYFLGNLHSISGPAICCQNKECPDLYYIFGVQYTKTAWEAIISDPKWKMKL